jgi:radical SAM superfamily enzyme YgiQ (UPF0313 family)
VAKVMLVQSAYFYKHHTHLQPMGILYLASALRAAGHEPAIIDMKVEYLDMAETVRRIVNFAPDVLGITAMTYEADCMQELVEAARKAMPGLKIVVGGAHAANLPEPTLRKGPGIDAVVIGEGEVTLPELIEAFEGKRELASVQGIAFLDQDAFVKTEARPYIEDLDAYPWPAWDLVPMKKYFDIPRGGLIYAHREFMTVFTSRSCPYRCVYCHRNLGKGYRPRNPKRVVDEIETLVKEHGIREILIMDDMFNLKRERVHAICQDILDRGLNIKMTFPNGLRADLLDKETLAILKRAGMYRTMLAIESGSERVQKYIKKNVNLKKARQSIEDAVSLGIMTHGAFMLGFPTETESEMHETIEFARTSKFHTAAFYRVLPFPGSELHEMVLEQKPDLEVTPERFEYHSSDVNLSAVPEETVTRLRKQAYRSFYMSPIRLARILYRLPHKLTLIPGLFRVFLHRTFER